MNDKQDTLNKILNYNEIESSSQYYKNFLYARIYSLDLASLIKLLEQYYLTAPAIRNAISRKIEQNSNNLEFMASVETIILKTLKIDIKGFKYSRQMNSFLSLTYENYSPQTREKILEHWVNRNTVDTHRRWLKKSTEDEMFFCLNSLINYWHTFRDYLALRILVKKLSPDAISEHLEDFVLHADEIWLVGKAFVKSTAISEQQFDLLKDCYPATYLYVCIKRKIFLPAPEVEEVSETIFEKEPKNIGLAIWAIGHLGYCDLLNKLEEKIENLPHSFWLEVDSI